MRGAGGTTLEQLPAWQCTNNKAEASRDPLERMVFNHEPANSRHAEEFRQDLAAALDYWRRKKARR